MTWGRTMGFMWGAMFGVCLAFGFFLDPKCFLLGILPVAGNYLHRHDA